ncbi:MAG: YtxH domain-containing protein [Polyangia bacterium]
MTKDIKNLDREQILKTLGLAQGSPTSAVLWSLAMVGIGVLAGAGVTLLLAPRVGRELRDQVSRKLKRTANDVATAAKQRACTSATEGGLETQAEKE